MVIHRFLKNDWSFKPYTGFSAVTRLRGKVFTCRLTSQLMKISETNKYHGKILTRTLCFPFLINIPTTSESCDFKIQHLLKFKVQIQKKRVLKKLRGYNKPKIWGTTYGKADLWPVKGHRHLKTRQVEGTMRVELHFLMLPSHFYLRSLTLHGLGANKIHM